jgi:hypothetical protein
MQVVDSIRGMHCDKSVAQRVRRLQELVDFQITVGNSDYHQCHFEMGGAKRVCASLNSELIITISGPI